MLELGAILGGLCILYFLLAPLYGVWLSKEKKDDNDKR